VQREPRPGDLVTIDAERCVELLHRAPWIRLAFVTDDGPTILPVNHVIHGESIYFRTAPGSKLGTAAASGRIALEADGGDTATRMGWSVVAHGHASIVTDNTVVEQLMALPFEPWALPEDKVFWVRIDVDSIDGREIVRTAD
jgi:uncharacterized protein